MPVAHLPELAEQASWWQPIFGGLTGLAGAGALAALAVPALSRILLPKPEEASLANALPFDIVLDDGKTLRCKDGSLTRTLSLEGLDSAALGPEERRDLWRRRRSFIEALGDHGITAKLMIQKRSARATRPIPLVQPVLNELLTRYLSGIGAFYELRHVLILTIPDSGARSLAKLDAAAAEVTRLLQVFSPRELGQGSNGTSDLLSFWGSLTDPVRAGEVSPSHDRIADRLAGATIEIEAGTGAITFDSCGRRKSARIVGVKLFGDATTEELAPRLLSVDGEFTLLFQLRTYSSAQAMIALERRERMMMSSRYNNSIQEQFDATREMTAQGAVDRQCLTDCEILIVAFGDNDDAARTCSDSICDILRLYRLTPVIETAIAQPQWFSQFPSAPFTALTRAATLLSKNAADLISFERESPGLPRSDWGKGEILPFRSLSGSRYLFQFHRSAAKEESGHMIVIGANGSGKTLLMELLTMGALRHDHVKCFWLDRFFGTYAFTTAIGGRYISTTRRIGATQAGRLNPLQLPLQFDESGHVVGRNADHLRNWFRILLDLDDPQSDEQIGRALFLLKDLPPEYRELKVLEDAFDHGTPARQRLGRWTDPMQYGGIFGGIPEAVGFDSRLTSFDMTTLLDDPVLGPPAVEHILFRIEAATEAAGDGSLIVVDEAAQLCAHVGFRKRIVQYLQQIRKKRGVVVLMFQRSSNLDEIDPGFARLMRSETTNQIFFPVPGTKPEDYSTWDLTDRELDFVTGRLDQARHMRRPFLLRRPKAAPAYSGILESDLSALGEWLGLMRSGSETVSEILRLQESGTEDWIAAFLANQKRRQVDGEI